MNNHSVIELLAQKIANRKKNIDNDFFNSEHIVFIIGAGASHEDGGLPLGKDFAAMLKNRILKDSSNNSLEDKFNESIAKLHEKYNFDPDDFKTILFALNKINPEKLVDLVVKELSYKPKQYVIYDIISSFFAKNLIDCIINFNFDELLDDNIKKKLVGNYPKHFVYTEDTCEGYMTSFINFYETPLYIKPHGTISCRKSLRFHRKDFHVIQKCQVKLIKKVLQKQKTTIITFGFRLKFPEFSQIIADSSNEQTEIIIIDRDENILDKNLLQYYRGNFIQVFDTFSLVDIIKHLEHEVICCLNLR